MRGVTDVIGMRMLWDVEMMVKVTEIIINNLMIIKSMIIKISTNHLRKERHLSLRTIITARYCKFLQYKRPLRDNFFIKINKITQLSPLKKFPLRQDKIKLPE